MLCGGGLAALWLLLLATGRGDAARTQLVTCGSALKLRNVAHEARLHSHDVKYGSGSGQQSVTAVPNSDDHNSHWALLGPMDKPCGRGSPIKCGDVVRLKHLSTGCHLHSHLFTSPLSRNQEVSCFAGDDGFGDTGDHWEILCDGTDWSRSADVRLKHVDTGTFLTVAGEKYGRPIAGQYEVSAGVSQAADSRWRAAEGVFMVPQDDL